MAYVFSKGRVEIDSNVLEDVQSVKLDIERDAVETTAMGDDWKDFIPGLLSFSVTIEFFQNLADNKIDEQMWDLITASAAKAVKIRPTNAAISVNNPEFRGNVVATADTPVQGSPGDAAMLSLTLQGSGALTRATSA